MSNLCEQCGHELPNAVGHALYCTNCGEPISSTAKTIEHVKERSNVIIGTQLAVLGVRIYRVVADKWADDAASMEDLIFTFNELPATVIKTIVNALVEEGLLIEVSGAFTPAADAVG